MLTLPPPPPPLCQGSFRRDARIDLSKNSEKSSITCDGLPAAEYPHVSVVPDEDELAADAHVEAGDDHDRTRDHAPQQQKEQRPNGKHDCLLAVGGKNT